MSDIGLSVLMGDFGNGDYAPIAIVGSEEEATECATTDSALRAEEYFNGANVQPVERYRLFTRNAEGAYEEIESWAP